jgi:hypothetical protein
VSTHPLVTMRAKLEMGRFYLRARKMSEATSHITDALRSAMAIWDAMPEMSQEAKTAWHILATRIREIAEDSVSILNVWRRDARMVPTRQGRARVGRAGSRRGRR